MKKIYTGLSWGLLMLLICMTNSCGNKGPLTIPHSPEQLVQQQFGAK